jgi:hypothetical protein
VYVVIDDPKDPSLLYVGTEFGVYFSRDGGARWTRLRGGLPTIQVRDMAIHERDDDLVIATFGRGFWVLDDLAPLRALTPQVLASSAALLPVPKTPLFVEASPLGGRGASFQGSEFYVAQNPPFGATFTYYLRDQIRTRKETRQQAERAAARRNADVAYPSWDTLRVEDREEAPSVILTVTDTEGHVVRRLAGPVTAGVQRVTWDLRYPPTVPNAGATLVGGGAGEGDDFFRAPAGPFVLPGTYTVSMARRVDGVTTPIGTPQKFEVYMLDGDTSPRTPVVLAFQQQTSKLQRAVLGANALVTETLTRVQALRRVLQETPSADDKLANDARALELTLRDIQTQLTGDPTMARRSEPTPPSMINRLNGITNSLWSNTLDAPTATQRHQYEIVSAEFEKVLTRLRPVIETDLRRVEEQAEAAGAPWTSGRLPVWKP